mmetsp:Transcript_23742/g.33201  ORF Transcript_23742/g.33201 Transcript_23742/m.33201 type:complete len:654 (+) Transcript_23742:386-2347(+)|eukprot:CAMPEP_0184487698 /NCGR_PEP_ID=MMETSP0113_2-20130426/10277_1 /TAXON_ID=91329 /ORGANISM="Norrisiella sphaerica, Strain BC52" /LENGTH=653 /DNA_ID=CAMNT_0026870081 /DNA_START=386 /DNA_END=2347 /DNA_ORIENTATION=+
MGSFFSKGDDADAYVPLLSGSSAPTPYNHDDDCTRATKLTGNGRKKGVGATTATATTGSSMSSCSNDTDSSVSISESVWLDRLCVCGIGVAATAPVYYILYCLGWLKLCQGNGVVLMLLVTFYPSGLLTLLVQLFFDHRFDTALGRRRAMLIRFVVTVTLNVALLPTILPYAPNTMILVLVFVILGFANAACVGSAYEVCLQMAPHVKAIQYLSIGLQAGGVITGILGLVSGYTSLSSSTFSAGVVPGNASPFTNLPDFGPVPVPPPPLSWGFTLLTSILCCNGLIGIGLMHTGSHHYRSVTSKHLSARSLAQNQDTSANGPFKVNTRGRPFAPASAGPGLNDIYDTIFGELRLSSWSLIITTSVTALTTGFYPFLPSSSVPGSPEANAGLVVLLIYVNQIADLIGRFIPTCVSCPSGSVLVLLTNARMLILVPMFFWYISQRWLVSDNFAILMVTLLQISHGILHTWAFVYSSQCKGSDSSQCKGTESPRKPNTLASFGCEEDKREAAAVQTKANYEPSSSHVRDDGGDIYYRVNLHAQSSLSSSSLPYPFHPGVGTSSHGGGNGGQTEGSSGGSGSGLDLRFGVSGGPGASDMRGRGGHPMRDGEASIEEANSEKGAPARWTSKLLMIVLQSSVVIGGITGQALAWAFFSE